MIKLFLFVLLVFPSVSKATTCVKDYAGTNSCVENENTAGDCETLGYLNKDVSGCTNYLYCPFNTNYKRCVAGGNEIDCEELGYTTDDKSAWCSNVIECPSDTAYTACVGQCVYSNVCVDKTDEATVSMPSANAELKYTNCTACGETRQIVTGWECNKGYKYITDSYNLYASCKNGKCCLKCDTYYTSVDDYAKWDSCTDQCYDQYDESCNQFGNCDSLFYCLNLCDLDYKAKTFVKC